MADGGRTGSSGGERDATAKLAGRYIMAGERTGTPHAGRGRTMPGGMSRGAPTRASGCRPDICLMVEYRTGGDWARVSRAHGSGVIQSGGTGRAGRDGSCRAGGVRAGADHADHVCVGLTEAMRYADWWRRGGWYP